MCFLRHLAIVLPSVDAGGAQRVASILARGLLARGWRVDVVSLTGEDEPAFFDFGDVCWYRLGVARPTGSLWEAVVANLTRTRILRQAFCQSAAPVILAFTDQANILTLLASRGLGRRVVVSERNDPRYLSLPRPWRVLRRWTYGWAGRVTCQSEPVARWLAPMTANPVTVIPNPIEPPSLHSVDRIGRQAVAMGRLVPDKGFDLLLSAFAQIATSYPDWNLTVWGEGPERDCLEHQAQDLGVASRVSFPGITREPTAVLAGADVFVLSSRLEGFPNVLGEAMASGCAVISFDCPCGPAEIITPEVDGILVKPESVRALAEGLDRLFGQPALRCRLGESARRIIERFSTEAALTRWEEVLLDRNEGDGLILDISGVKVE